MAMCGEAGVFRRFTRGAFDVLRGEADHIDGRLSAWLHPDKMLPSGREVVFSPDEVHGTFRHDDLFCQIADVRHMGMNSDIFVRVWVEEGTVCIQERHPFGEKQLIGDILIRGKFAEDWRTNMETGDRIMIFPLEQHGDLVFTMRRGMIEGIPLLTFPSFMLENPENFENEVKNALRVQICCHQAEPFLRKTEKKIDVVDWTFLALNQECRVWFVFVNNIKAGISDRTDVDLDKTFRDRHMVRISKMINTVTKGRNTEYNFRDPLAVAMLMRMLPHIESKVISKSWFKHAQGALNRERERLLGSRETQATASSTA